jgi:transcription-repair coupling factor (superfamily II helicase)
MLDKVLQLKNNKNSVNEFLDCVRQGIPSAAFGVTDAFKNYLVSVIPDKVLLVVKDGVTAHISAEGISELSGKKVVIVPPRDELLLNSRAFSKDSVYARIKAFSEIKQADVIIATAETLMQSCPKIIESIEFIKDTDCDQENTVKELVRLGYSRVEATVSAGDRWCKDSGRGSCRG